MIPRPTLVAVRREKTGIGRSSHQGSAGPIARRGSAMKRRLSLAIGGMGRSEEWRSQALITRSVRHGCNGSSSVRCGLAKAIPPSPGWFPARVNDQTDAAQGLAARCPATRHEEATGTWPARIRGERGRDVTVPAVHRERCARAERQAQPRRPRPGLATQGCR